VEKFASLGSSSRSFFQWTFLLSGEQNFIAKATSFLSNSVVNCWLLLLVGDGMFLELFEVEIDER